MSTHPLIHPAARIDPTARVDPAAVIDAEAIVGPHCTVGPGTRLRTRAILVERVTLGAHNDVHPYAVIGGDPQDRTYDPERPGEVIIGDRNIFREHCTIHRGNWNGTPTRVGSGCFLMCQTHLAHNASIGDNVVMANGAVLAGHARLGNGVVMSAYAMVHQFTIVGDLVMFRGGAGVGMHTPPYVVLAGENFVAGLNRVGLARSPDVTRQDRDEIKHAYRAIYREREAEPILSVLARLREQSWGRPAEAFIRFCEEALAHERPRQRGIVGGRRSRARTQPGLAAASLD